MTTRVQITHSTGSHDIWVKKLSPPLDGVSEEAHIEFRYMKAGDTAEFYIWGDQKLIIEETPIVDEDHPV